MSDVPLTKEERARRIREIEKEFPLLKSDSDSDTDKDSMTEVLVQSDLDVSVASSTTIELSPVKKECDEGQRDSPFKTPVKPIPTPKKARCKDRVNREREPWAPFFDEDISNVVPTLKDFPATTPEFKKTDDLFAFYKERALRSRAITAKYMALGKETPFDEWVKMPAAWRIEDGYLNPGTPIQGLKYSDDESDSDSPAKVAIKKRRIEFE